MDDSFFSWTNLLCAMLYSSVGIVVLFAISKPKLFYIILVTLPRDFRVIYGLIQCLYAMRKFERNGDTIGKIFDRTAAKYKNKISFYFEDEKWTFSQVYDLTNKIANYFQSKGFKKGDSIALFMENRVEYIAFWFGLSKLGVTPVLINTNLKGHPLQHCFKAVQCNAIIFGRSLTTSLQGVLSDEAISGLQLYASGKGPSDLLEKSIDLDSLLESASAEPPILSETLAFNDTLCYIFTSGTTGFPKAAVIKHSRYARISLYSRILYGFTPEDIMYTTMPFYHSSAGNLGVGHALLTGGTVVIRQGFSARSYWKDCIKYNCTVAQYIGEICRYLLAQPEGPEDRGHKVRFMFGNGLRPDIWTQFQTRFGIKKIGEFYGSSEGNCNAANIDGKIGAVGFIPVWIYPVLYTRLIKVDNDGEPIRDPKTGLLITCQPGEFGELVCVIKKGHIVRDFQGYADSSSTQKKLVKDCFKKGDSAFRSGDLLVMDEFGYLYFKDRTGDTFRWKGENVSTAEVESVVSRICGLNDSVVFGVQIPGQEGRSGMAAIANPDGTLDLENLATEIVNQLPSYAIPLFIRIVKEIDQTGTYKMKKTELQADGFDLKKVTDPIYFFTSGKYVLLDENLLETILSGEIRI